MNKKITMTMVALSGATLFAGGNPDEWHAWFSNDWLKPNPKVVRTAPGKPPSDAIVLFDGTEESLKKNWKSRKGCKGWKFEDGAMLPSGKGAGDILTVRDFEDCQIHLEWCAPELPPEVKGQNRGNSGVYLMGNYEIQVLDSSNCDPDAPGGNPNKTYADGQAGALYGDYAPLVNAVGPGGTWQTYDIVFHPPRFRDGKVAEEGSVTVLLNGVLVQDHTLLNERLRYQRLSRNTKGPLLLQDHNNPTRYRNIWIRELPSRYADKIGGGPGTDPAAVKAHRIADAQEAAAKGDYKRAAAMDPKPEYLEKAKAKK